MATFEFDSTATETVETNLLESVGIELYRLGAFFFIVNCFELLSATTIDLSDFFAGIRSGTRSLFSL